MQINDLKRKEDQAQLSLSPSLKKKQGAANEFDLPSTVTLPSGEIKWRTVGIESKQLKKGFQLYKLTKGLDSLAYPKGSFDSKYIEERRVSQDYWKVYTPRKFAQQYRRAAERFRDKANIEEDKAGGRSMFIFV